MNNRFCSTVEKALQIIEHLLKSEEEKRITELAKELKINSSTVQRIVNTLQERNYLCQDSMSKKYKLGLKFLELSENVLEKIDLRKAASPHLRQLRDQVGETVHLMVLNGMYGVYIDAVESPKRSRVVTSVGIQADLYDSAVGKAILAFLMDEEIERIIRIRGLKAKTPNTITDRNLLKDDLSKTRNRGYSLDNEEGEIGTRCLGAPILNHTGEVIGSISIAAPIHRMSSDKLSSYIPLVLETARNISIEIGVDSKNTSINRGQK